MQKKFQFTCQLFVLREKNMAQFQDQA